MESACIENKVDEKRAGKTGTLTIWIRKIRKSVNKSQIAYTWHANFRKADSQIVKY